MALILAIGSNLGDKEKNLSIATKKLSQVFTLLKSSEVYLSDPVDYIEQPKFFNQVLEFKMPKLSPFEILKKTQKIEEEMGRIKYIPKGPRIIDIDIIFIGLKEFDTPSLVIPHPEWMKRNFVFFPLKELPFFRKIDAKTLLVPPNPSGLIKIDIDHIFTS